MSADNWAQCPRCVAQDKALDEKRKADIQASYGKVTPEEFVAAVNAFEPTWRDNSLREDYEQGVGVDGVYTVSYSCRCDTCDFRWKYHHTAIACAPTEPR